MHIQKNVFSTIACATLIAFGSLAATKPNFVVIFIDDMGYADIGPSAPQNKRRPTSTRWPRTV